jgi:hypothetical protein
MYLKKASKEHISTDVPNLCPNQISAVVIGRHIHTCPDRFFKLRAGEGQIQRMASEPELQNAGRGVSSQTITGR